MSDEKLTEFEKQKDLAAREYFKEDPELRCDLDFAEGADWGREFGKLETVAHYEHILTRALSEIERLKAKLVER